MFKKKHQNVKSSNAFRWPTKLEISFEQGLSPTSGKSSKKKQYSFTVPPRKILSWPIKTPKLNTKMKNFFIMSRRLTAVARSSKNKTRIRENVLSNVHQSNVDKET